MPILTPLYSSAVNLLSDLTGIKSCPNNTGVFCNIQSMETLRYSDVQLSIDISAPNGTGSGYSALWIMPSHDGNKWDNATALVNIATNQRTNLSLAVAPSVIEIAVIQGYNNIYWTGMVGRLYGTLPKFWSLIYVNNTGGALHATYNHTITATYITNEYV